MKKYLSLGDAIDKFLDKYGLKDEILIQDILSNWEKHMGKPIASNTEKVWFEGGTLFIKVSSPVWRNELMMARHSIQKMVNTKVNKVIVKEVKIL